MSGRSEDEDQPMSKETTGLIGTKRANIDLKINNDGGVAVKYSSDE